jgi:curli biogenesis system outer membrane secretion channel CsgG
MRKAVPICLLLLTFVTAMNAADTAARKKRVAIMDFDYATVHSAVASMFGSDVDVGKGIADLLVKDLVKDGTYSVIERKSLDKILAEQNFSTSDRANPASAAKIGKLLGVDAIIVGSITQFGGENKNTKVGGGGGGWGGFGLGGVGHSKSKAIVNVDARIVNIDTGEIEAVAEGHGESSRSSTSLLGGGGSWHGFGGGGVDFGSSGFQETIIGEAVKQAVDQMSAEVIQGNAKVGVRTVQVEGLVAFVQSDKVVLNVGGKAGLKVGDQLKIERVSQEIKDPATGKVIRRMSSQIGMVQITDLDEQSAEAKIVTGNGFKVGDVARTATQ